MSGDSEDDDVTLNLRIQFKEHEALERLLQLYGPRAKGYLKKHYGDVLCDADIDAALFQAADRAWRYGDSFDPSKGTLKSWFFRIVQRQAIDIINDNTESGAAAFDLDLHDRPYDSEPASPKMQQLLAKLEDCIGKLARVQQAIIRADLKSEDVAGAARLAQVLGSSENSIHVSRIKARENLKKCVNAVDPQGSKGAKS